MIQPKEINAIAGKYKLKDTQVEKDYVLTWVLFGISQNQLLSKALVFKGGTALKKIFFEDYRFSEDLDFTLLDEKISNEEILKEFEKAYSFVKESANITLQFKEMNIHSASGISRLSERSAKNIMRSFILIPCRRSDIFPLTCKTPACILLPGQPINFTDQKGWEFHTSAKK